MPLAGPYAEFPDPADKDRRIAVYVKQHKIQPRGRKQTPKEPVWSFRVYRISLATLRIVRGGLIHSGYRAKEDQAKAAALDFIASYFGYSYTEPAQGVTEAEYKARRITAYNLIVTMPKAKGCLSTTKEPAGFGILGAFCEAYSYATNRGHWEEHARYRGRYWFVLDRERCFNALPEEVRQYFTLPPPSTPITHPTSQHRGVLTSINDNTDADFEFILDMLADYMQD